MNEFKTIIPVVLILALMIPLCSCNVLRRSAQKPGGEIKRVAYADKILLQMHPEKVLNYLPNLKDEQIAYLFGMTVEEYLKVKREYDNEAKDAATKLLQDKDFADKVAALPFRKNETVMILGESTTDALNSWAVILSYLLKIKRSNDNIQIINNAVSGQTTTEALKRITTQIKQKPDWLLCFLGSNDCGRYGGENNKTNVSIAETMNNLNTIRKIVADESPQTKFVWLAPLPVNEKKVSSFIWFRKIELTFRNTDLMAIDDSIKLKKEAVIDFRDDFGVPAQSKFLQWDGAHLSIEGQTLFVKRLVNNLSK